MADSTALASTNILPQKITSNKNTQLNLDRFRQDEFKDESAQCTLLVRDYRRVPRNSLVSSDRDDAVRVAYVGHVTF
ncbi:palindromic element RPE3 domain-containing protein [Rickettsia gravesii]|uniref:palindromic element RPE3 domain-containing protein n=1 Tax=Rickettsia gravesii TaxID=354585 RepID=UPI0004B1B7A9